MAALRRRNRFRLTGLRKAILLNSLPTCYVPPYRPAAGCPSGMAGLLARRGRIHNPEVLRMKKVCMCLALGLVTIAWSVQTASALPPFNKAWTEKYVEGNSNAKFVEAVGTAKCNV